MSWGITEQDWRAVEGAACAGSGMVSVTQCPYTGADARDWLKGYVDYLATAPRNWPELADLSHVRPCSPTICRGGQPWTNAEILFIRLAARRVPDDLVGRLLCRPGDAVRLKRGRLRRIGSGGTEGRHGRRPANQGALVETRNDGAA